MKKKLLLLTSIVFSWSYVSAQTKEALIAYFNSETNKKNEYLLKLISSQKSQKSADFLLNNKNVISNISKDEISILSEADIKSNKTSNITELQAGAVGGFSLSGENITIAMFDSGPVMANHGEFRDLSDSLATRIIDLENLSLDNNNHATNVAGIIAAEGRYIFDGTANASVGVLPKGIVKYASFAETINGDRFVKLLQYGEYISNHSYSANNGWVKETSESGPSGEGYYYIVNSSTIMTDANQTLFSAYQINDQSIDKLVYADQKYIIVKSSGNNYGIGPGVGDNKYRWGGFNYVPFDSGEIIPNGNCSNGAYCIGNGSLAKNIIVVGAIDIPNTPDNKITSPSQIVRSSYSGVGPRKDGGIKPDLVAVGTGVITTSIDSENLESISSLSVVEGTSYSTAIVTGAVGALTELKRQLINDPNYSFFSDEMKALLLHTTMEAGDFEGPDNWYGWGLLDAKKSAELILSLSNGENFMERKSKVSGTDNEELFYSTGEELKVTISWVDPAANFDPLLTGRINDFSSKLVNDLDVRVIDTETNEEYFPWKLDFTNVTGAAIKGDNTVDNVEQISIKTPVVGREYKVIVSNKGNLVNDTNASSNQDYTILITGVTAEPLSTDDVISKSETLVYPTVTKDFVNVKTTEKIQKVDVIDLTGKLISTTKTDKVNVSSLPAGVYIVNITTDKGVTTKKIVKQ